MATGSPGTVFEGWKHRVFQAYPPGYSSGKVVVVVADARAAARVRVTLPSGA